MNDRVTRAQIEAKVQTVNRMLGMTDVRYNTIGAIETAWAYGGVKIIQITEGLGSTDLSQFSYGTVPQADNFLDGMLRAIQIMKRAAIAATEETTYSCCQPAKDSKGATHAATCGSVI